MWFPHFRRRSTHKGRDDELVGSRAWGDSGLAGEIQAFLAGRLADHIAAAGQTVPAWAALNRLAHAERSELLRLVEGAGLDRLAHPSSRQPAWVATERSLAGQLLARSRTPDDLARVQQAALVPVELRFIERSKIDRFTAEQVLEAGAEALDSFHPGQ
jgi:hypothetical protein